MASLDFYHIAVKVLGIAHAVKTRHRRDHYHILPPRQQCRHGGETQLLNLVVDHEVFLDILVNRRYVGLGLIIIVI